MHVACAEKFSLLYMEFGSGLLTVAGRGLALVGEALGG